MEKALLFWWRHAERMCFPTGCWSNPPCLLQNEEQQSSILEIMEEESDKSMWCLRNLGWTQAVLLTEWRWGSQMERSPGLDTCWTVGRRPPGPSNQAGLGTCQDRGCKTGVRKEKRHIVAGWENDQTLGDSVPPRTMEEYRFWTSFIRSTYKIGQVVNCCI